MAARRSPALPTSPWPMEKRSWKACVWPAPRAPVRWRRREFLGLGLVGLGSLAWPELLRRRAEAGSKPDPGRHCPLGLAARGASHLETYDPKPVAPADTAVPTAHPHPGPWLQVSELLPQHALVAHRFTLLRSLAHYRSLPRQGPQQLFTGFPITGQPPQTQPPDLFAIVDKLPHGSVRRCRTTSAFPPIPISGCLPGPPTSVRRDGRSNDPQFEVPHIGLKDRQQIDRLDGRYAPEPAA